MKASWRGVPSPHLAFTMAIEIIIRASKCVVGVKQLQCGQRLPPIRAYIDDITTVTLTTVPCTKRLLDNLHQNITWANMKLKPSKCRRISIVKGQIKDDNFILAEHQSRLFQKCQSKAWDNGMMQNSRMPSNLNISKRIPSHTWIAPIRPYCQEISSWGVLSLAYSQESCGC